MLNRRLRIRRKAARGLRTKPMQIHEHETETPAIELCLYPNECCMAGPHLPFECHTAEMAEALAEEAEGAFN